jgi:hypothetical protein
MRVPMRVRMPVALTRPVQMAVVLVVTGVVRGMAVIVRHRSSREVARTLARISGTE